MLQYLGYAAGVLGLAMFVPYIRDILRRKTKPQRASWLIWAVLGSIAVASQFAEGARDSLWMTVGQTIGTITTFVLALRFGVGGLARKDLVSLALAGAGLYLWYLTRHASVALFITIAIDAMAGLLTAEKAYRRPETETLAAWELSAAAGVLGALAVGSWNLVLLAYPVYVFMINGVVIGAILLGRVSRRRHPRRT